MWTRPMAGHAVAGAATIIQVAPEAARALDIISGQTIILSRNSCSGTIYLLSLPRAALLHYPLQSWNQESYSWSVASR